jgi:hypothetical protein
MKTIYLTTVLTLLVAASPVSATAGLFEWMESDESAWLEDDWRQLSSPMSFRDVLLTPDWKARTMDSRFDPIFKVQTIFVHTRKDAYTLTLPDESVVNLDSTRMDPSRFGHRRGFVLEKVEFGFKGRFNRSGLYYRFMGDLVPKEKDGNRSDDYLRDAYVGWDRYRMIDVRVGRMKIPFSQANMKDPLFIYNANLDALTPKRQLGAQLELSDPWKALRLRGAVVNSVKQAQEQIKEYEQLMYVGRVDLNFANVLGIWGLRPGDLDINFGVNYARTEEHFDPRAEHRWFGADLRLHFALLTVEAEYVSIDYYTEPNLDGSQDAHRGYGYHVDVALHTWPGVVDLAFRWDRSDGSRELVQGFSSTLSTDELVAQGKEWFVYGLRWFVDNRTTLELNYVNRRQMEGYTFNSDVFLVMLQYQL